MNTDSQDNNLRQLFHELRDSDERATPSFARVVRRAETQHEPAHPLAWTLRVAAGVGLLAVLGLGWWMLRPKSEPAQPVIASITEWESPTDFLLSMSTATDDTQSTSAGNQ